MVRAAVGIAGALLAVVIGGALWSNMECSDGKVVRNSWQCVRNAGFDPAFCNGVFQAQEEAISRAPVAFASVSACRSQFANCVQSTKPVGWIAKPTPYCVISGSDGRPAQITPYSD